LPEHETRHARIAVIRAELETRLAGVCRHMAPSDVSTMLDAMAAEQYRSEKLMNDGSW
jgi:hypothetical protein